MGMINLFGSSSYFDKCECGNKSMGVGFSWSRNLSQEKISNPNPDPRKYDIRRSWTYKNYLVIEIKYIGCTNYEGKKILVFKNATVDDLKRQKVIDPHFSENKRFFSPVARFEPTKTGWSNASKFIKLIADMEERENNV